MIRKILDAIRTDLFSDSERGHLIRSAGLTGGLKIGAMVIAFVASILYARSMGKYEYGLFSYVYAWITLAVIPATLGIPTYLIREGSRHRNRLQALRKHSDRYMIIAGIAVGLLMIFCAFILANGKYLYLFIIGAPLPLLLNLSEVRSSILRACNKYVLSQWGNLFLGPLITLVFIAIWWQATGFVRASDLLIMTVIAAAMVLVVNNRHFVDLRVSDSASFFPPPRIGELLPFMWLGVIFYLNSHIDIIMLGSLQGADSSGIYSISSRIAGLVPFFLITANLIISPRISQLYHQQEMEKLQRLISGAVIRIFLLTVAPALVLVFFSGPLLEFVYGSEFSAGAHALVILTLAQLVNVAAGPTGVLMNMTGHEKITGISVGISAVINIVLNFTLIPWLDYTGAAIATGSSLILWNLILVWYCRTRIGIRTSIL